MTKKHFIALAAAIAAEPDEAKRKFACEVIIKVASEANFNFVPNIFRHACKVPLRVS